MVQIGIAMSQAQHQPRPCEVAMPITTQSIVRRRLTLTHSRCPGRYHHHSASRRRLPGRAPTPTIARLRHRSCLSNELEAPRSKQNFESLSPSAQRLTRELEASIPDDVKGEQYRG